ncbi:MAG: hypothetical protein JKY46_02335 [Robiginitomaculum sp.]|nr:hypothetical protein [Robiginitomaculum sp.]
MNNLKRKGVHPVHWVWIGFLVTIAVLWIFLRSPFGDPWVGAYEDFFAPRAKFASPMILDIPIDELNGTHSQEFSLPLVRRYGLRAKLVIEDGLSLSDPDTHIQADIKIYLLDGSLLKSINITKDYPIETRPPDILPLYFRELGGIDKSAKLVITNLRIVKSDALKNEDVSKLGVSAVSRKPPLIDLRVRFSIYSYPVFLH